MKVVEFRGHERPVNQVRFNRDGDLLFSCGTDKIVNMYDIFTYEKIGTFETTSACKTIDVSVDSEYLVTGCLDGKLAVYQCNGGSKIFEITRKNKVKFVQFSYSSDLLLVLYEWASDIDIAVYSFKRILEESKKSTDVLYENFKPEFYIRFPEHKFMRVIWGPLNETLFGSTENGNIVQFDLGGKILQDQKLHEGEARCLVFANDFSFLASCGMDGGRILDPTTLKVMRYFKTDVPMNTIALQPLIAEQANPSAQKYHLIMAGGIASRDAAQNKKGGFEVHLCDIRFGEEKGTISAHFSPINSLIFTTDGRGFVSAAEEGVVKYVRFDNNYWESE